MTDRVLRALQLSRRGDKGGQVPSLKHLAMCTLIDNVDLITDVGDIPDDLLEPILSKASPSQLKALEEAAAARGRKLNTESLWKRKCQRMGISCPLPNMTWKEAYENHIQQEEKKTRDLLQKIRAAAQKHAQARAEKCVKVIGQPLPSRSTVSSYDKRPKKFSSRVPDLFQKSIMELKRSKHK